MGKLERLDRYFDGNRPLSEEELKDSLEAVERDIQDSWERFRNYHEAMHDAEVKASALRMVLLWLLRKGLI